MKHLFTAALLLLSLSAWAQKKADKHPDAEKDIKKTINRFFEGMEKGDTTLLKSTCMPDMVLQTYMVSALIAAPTPFNW